MGKPPHPGPVAASLFQDPAVAQAYRHRPPYPPEVFDILVGLISAQPRHVLDVGCGTGDLARVLATRVARVDAVDFSQPMIDQGRQLPGGDHPRLRWLHGRVEDVELSPPYALVTAGASLHWMDWAVVLPRFWRVLVDGGYLAIVNRDTEPDPWSALGDLVARYRTDGGWQPFDLIEELVRRDLFTVAGEKWVGPVPFVQPIGDFIASYHSRSPFSPERMGQAQAAAFDQEARRFLRTAHGDGVIHLDVTAHVVWGSPRT